MRMAGGNITERSLLLLNCTEGGNSVPEVEGDALGVEDDGMDGAVATTHVRVGAEGLEVLPRSTNNILSRKRRADDGSGQSVNSKNPIDHENLVLLLLDERAFNESRATRVLSKHFQGFEFLFGFRAADKLRTAITLARVLVFQENTSQRFERAKAYIRRTEPESCEKEEVEKSVHALEKLLRRNHIDIAEFSKDTYEHFHRRTGKKNLYFYGAPNTGKTMIMESLMLLDKEIILNTWRQGKFDVLGSKRHLLHEENHVHKMIHMFDHMWCHDCGGALFNWTNKEICKFCRNERARDELLFNFYEDAADEEMRQIEELEREYDKSNAT
ncbi:uncharacterized protein LOC143909638 [Arctopsyche grandis]|uniref:uncharacterized protein LOC143909638 n=1 Tax=Arctopsyche grandis TaxID=121162 RepID=UPI00406D808A